MEFLYDNNPDYHNLIYQNSYQLFLLSLIIVVIYKLQNFNQKLKLYSRQKTGICIHLPF